MTAVLVGVLAVAIVVGFMVLGPLVWLVTAYGIALALDTLDRLVASVEQRFGIWRLWSRGWVPRDWWYWVRVEGFPFWLARKLPRRVVQWVIVRVFVEIYPDGCHPSYLQVSSAWNAITQGVNDGKARRRREGGAAWWQRQRKGTDDLQVAVQTESAGEYGVIDESELARLQRDGPSGGGEGSGSGLN